MPLKERIRLHDNQDPAPVKQTPEADHHQPKGRGRALRSGLTLREQRQLLSEEQNLRHEGHPRANDQTEEGQQIDILQRAPGPDRFFAGDRSIAPHRARRNPWSLENLAEASVVATDGEVGRISNFLFDDQSWTIRYVAVDLRGG
jgi:hypothetical protein